MAPEPGTEDFADEVDMINWYKEQDKETFWKKISEKAIAIVNLAKRAYYHHFDESHVLSDAMEYCGDREANVTRAKFEEIYGGQQGKNQDIIAAIKNTAEPEEIREAEGEEL